MSCVSGVCLSVCPALTPMDFAPTPHSSNRGTCSTGLETGYKPVLLLMSLELWYFFQLLGKIDEQNFLIKKLVSKLTIKLNFAHLYTSTSKKILNAVLFIFGNILGLRICISFLQNKTWWADAFVLCTDTTTGLW